MALSFSAVLFMFTRMLYLTVLYNDMAEYSNKIHPKNSKIGTVSCYNTEQEKRLKSGKRLAYVQPQKIGCYHDTYRDNSDTRAGFV